MSGDETVGPGAALHPYRRARIAFAAAVRATASTASVPACPSWTVHNLLAHQVHQLSGALDGSFPVDDALESIGGSTADVRRCAAQRQERWIAAGVVEHSRIPVETLLDRWEQLESEADREVLDALVPDLVVHLYDLQGAAGRRPDRDEALLAPALAFWAAAAHADIPADTTAQFELLRTITGRRSREQAPTVPHELALYGWRRDPLVD